MQRLTDLVGVEESPAISPDGKAVAFVARVGGRPQIWVRLLASGIPVQITRDDTDHEQPRWTPDSSSIIYYSPSELPKQEGTIWEIPALGGPPRRIAASISGADVSHDGKRVALFHMQDGRTELALIARDGSSAVTHLKQLEEGYLHDNPRWSPDDDSIAFERRPFLTFDRRVVLLSVATGEIREVARGRDMRGFCWSPDGAALIYSSSAGSTVLYPPVYNLRKVGRDGNGDRQLTFGDVSFVEPDAHASGKLVASRIRSASDIWKIPVTGSAAENVRNAVRITRQTGQAQTPSLSPGGKELVYLSDSGGHGNLWVAATNGSGVRQITFERDLSVSLGVPVWSPIGSEIVFIRADKTTTGEWLVNADGSGLKLLLPQGVSANWSPDGRWIYYSRRRANGENCMAKAPSEGGPSIEVRCDNAQSPQPAGRSHALYFVQRVNGGDWNWDIRRAVPENGPSELLGQIRSRQVPFDQQLMEIFLSPDEKWLALPLSDDGTTNLWLMPVTGGPLRKITDYGDRPILIARQVAWSGDSKSIFAAVNESDADIVLLDGLLR